MLASDGKTLFNTMVAANFAKAGLDKRTEAVWAVDLETRKVTTVAMLEPTAERKRGIQALHGFMSERYVEDPRYVVHVPSSLRAVQPRPAHG